MNKTITWAERLARWILTFLAILLTLVFWQSMGRSAHWNMAVAKTKCHMVIASGAVRVMLYHEGTSAEHQSSSWSIANNPPGPGRWFVFWRPMWEPSSRLSVTIVPLWIPFIPIALLATMMWGVRFAKDRESP